MMCIWRRPIRERKVPNKGRRVVREKSARENIFFEASSRELFAEKVMSARGKFQIYGMYTPGRDNLEEYRQF
jgi:hypothetical protein